MAENMLTYALKYAGMQLPVFPIIPKDKKPLTEHGFKDATTDVATIRQWWLKWPDANIGMPTGAASGLVVIDIDIKNNGQYGWQGLLGEQGPLPHTAQSFTGNGMHLFFKHPGYAIKCSQSKIAHGVDVKADGGYVVLPPSVHPSGKSYGWELSSDIAEVTPVELPDWLSRLLSNTDEIAQPGPTWREPGSDSILEGKRNKTLASIAGYMQRAAIPSSAMVAALMEINTLRCKPPLSAQEIQAIVKSISRYEPDAATVICVEDKSDEILLGQIDDSAEVDVAQPDQVPLELLRIPGFISELMDYCMEYAPYPNQVLSFCGAVSLLSLLGARKVRDPGDVRTNLYLLGLAHSSAGKDSPRKLNTHILWQIGMGNCVGDKFASGEGIQDALFIEPAMLFQTDEIDTILQSIRKSVDGKNESMMGTLLTLFSSSASFYPMRKKAGKDAPRFIDQPSLTVFGTAIPNNYYEALSQRMLTNGLFARMIILDTGKREKGKRAKILKVPHRILEIAKYWAELKPGEGNLSNWHPVPLIIPQTSQAEKLIDEIRINSEAEYSKAEDRNDPIGTTVWGRVCENVCKLALIYAMSVDHRNPQINEAAAKWAGALMEHQTRRSLFMASEHSCESEFHGRCKKLLSLLRKWKEKHGPAWMPFWQISRKLPWSEREHEEVRMTLENQRLIDFANNTTGGRQQRVYRLTGH